MTAFLRIFGAFIFCAADVGSAQSTSVDYSVAGSLPHFKQPSPNTCWATAATIMLSWKEKREKRISDIVHAAGPQFEAWFRGDLGLSSKHKPEFLNSVGLKAEAPQNPTAVGWESLLRRYGPLWVTTNEGSNQDFAIHARILRRIVGDGSPDGTAVEFIDPATGSETEETLREFVRKIEEVARFDLGKSADIRLQIVHF